MRIVRRWFKKVIRHFFKARWYEIDMARYARETLAMLNDGDHCTELCGHLAVPLRDLLTLDQVATLYAIAGGLDEAV